jgi:purine-binding chemotaxis protein CheW
MFRVGAERFAMDIDAVDEALDAPTLHALPETGSELLGVISLRDRLVPVCAPESVLGVELSCAVTEAVLLVLSRAGGRVALAVDDVDDVLTVEHADVHRPPAGNARDSRDSRDVLLVGIARHGQELVALVDARGVAERCSAHHQESRR